MTILLELEGEKDLAELQLALMERAVGPSIQRKDLRINARLREQVAVLRSEIAAFQCRAAARAIDGERERWGRRRAVGPR